MKNDDFYFGCSVRLRFVIGLEHHVTLAKPRTGSKTDAPQVDGKVYE